MLISKNGSAINLYFWEEKSTNAPQNKERWFSNRPQKLFGLDGPIGWGPC